AIAHPKPTRAELRIAHRRATDPRELVQYVVDAPPNFIDVEADPFENARHDAFALIEKGAQQVLGRDLRVPRVARERLSGRERLLGLPGEPVRIYGHG